MFKNYLTLQNNKESIHNITYVGEKLFKKLLVAEKKRLKKKLKIKGVELERALTWSDINSGPKTELGGCNISGDIILVVPESSRQALGEFSSKIYRRERDAAINKIRANAAGATFYQWLLPQIDRPDRVGDIARDAVIDEQFPRESNLYEEIKSYLDSQGACSAAIESFKESWLEYIKQYPERIHPYAWCSECGDKLDVENAFLSRSSESQELFILDATCLNKYIQFDDMVSWPLSDITHESIEELVEKGEVSEFDSECLLERLKLWGVVPITIEGCIYFIRSEKTDAIKIGFTAGQVKKRLGSLQTAHPYKLQLLATTPGTVEYEKSLHARFSSHRLEGEWFKPHPDVLAFISVIKNGK
jgi:uncharacterized protein YozE (UPF0346 family)